MLRHTSDVLTAETIALKALAFIAARQADFNRFLASSGADISTLRVRAAEPETLAAVLDFLLANEELLTMFCGEEQTSSTAVHRAAARLGG